MKIALPLLLLLAFAFPACHTLSNRRDLYSPKQGEGPWTRSLEEGTWRDRGVKPVDEEYSQRRAAPKRTAPAS